MAAYGTVRNFAEIPGKINQADLPEKRWTRKNTPTLF
jgi:hypothetical protein